MTKFQSAAPQDKSAYDFIQKSVELILHDKHLLKYDWQPSHPHTIRKYEDELGIHLPRAFKEYLLAIGNTDDQMIFGRDPEMGLLTDVLKPEPWEAEEVLEYEKFVGELKSFPALCFSSHEGYAFDWFYLVPGEEDPECYFTDDLETIQASGPFSDYLLDSLIKFSKLLSYRQN